MAPSVKVNAAVEHWPIAGTFTISRGAKTEAAVVVAEVSDGRHRGRGECVPYPRYGETTEGVTAAILAMAPALAEGLDHDGLRSAMPAGAARNALDCALWDLDAKRSGKSAYDLLGMPPPQPLTTAYTISLGTPDAMAEAAGKAAKRPLLKVKLGGAGDAERIAAVRRAAPNAELIVDANEGWTPHLLVENLAACVAASVTMIEQPLPPSADDILATFNHPIPICADESFHDRASLAAIKGKYDAVNIKLDKTGGLTEAMAVADAAHELGLTIMVGCMVSTSLSIAPAYLVAQRARVIDLDGPLLLARDRPDGLQYAGSIVLPPTRALWG